MRLILLRRFVALVLAMLGLGCAATEVYEADQAPEYVVIKEYAPFFQEGPLQQRGPDLSLRINDRVKLLKKDFTGYVVVEISDGRRGYVGFEDLAPAPPRPPAPPPESLRSTSNRRSAGNSPAYTGPENNDISLPDLNTPLPNLNIGPEEIPSGPSMIDVDPSDDEAPKFRY